MNRLDMSSSSLLMSSDIGADFNEELDNIDDNCSLD